MLNWNEVSPKEKLSPNLTVGEWIGRVGAAYVNHQRCGPDAPLKVATVLELARSKYGKAIIVSSGVRTPNTNHGAKNSRHLLGIEEGGGSYCAMDFKPAGGFGGTNSKSGLANKMGFISYADFYGCFVWALSQIEDPYGLGIYPQSLSGIHVDCSFVLRAEQHRNIKEWNEKNKHTLDGIQRGYRWGQNYSFFGNAVMLTNFHRQYSDPNPTVKGWKDHAAALGVNLKLLEGQDAGADAWTMPTTSKSSALIKTLAWLAALILIGGWAWYQGKK